MEFKKVKLGEIIKVQIDNRGRNPEKYINYSKFPVIDNYLIKNEKYPNIKNVNRYIDEDTKNNFLRGHLEKDDVIITLVGNGIGNVTMVPSSKCVIIQNTLGLRCNELMTNDFLYYTLISNRNKIVKYNRGSSQPSIRKTDLFSYEINVPTINYQKKITKILNSLDSKIEINNKIISNLESQAQAIFKSWFVDFEPFQDGNFVESELGMIPEGWEVKKVNEICDLKIGRTPPRKESEWFSLKEGVKWVSIKDLGLSQMYISEVTEYLTEESIEKFNIPIVEENTLLLSFKLTVGRIAITTEKMCTNEAIAQFKDPLISTLFLFYYFKNFKFETLGNTSSIGNAVNSKIIKNIEVLVPPEKIVLKVMKMIEPLSICIRNLLTQNTKLAELRDALLPKLMAGEIDVSNIKIEGEEVKNE
ncbi:MAG: restriction endonuclease subunit S [Finegoldia magna]|nr:restriction endonuclease subunit S [Finegoldia magna]